MKAAQLRLGNLVKYGENIVPIKSIHTESVLKNEVTVNVELNEKIRNLCVYIYEIEPIPLTEDWLVKLGFRKNQNSEKYFLPIQNIKCEIHAERFRGVIVLEIHNHVMPIIPETESSVHGLQNLYFALTGKEINYKQTI